MDRNYLAFRILELIHEVTGIWLDEESPLDFESDHKGKMESIVSALQNEFLCVDYDDIPKWDCVSSIVKCINRRMRWPCVEDMVVTVKAGLNDPDFLAYLENELEVTISDEEAEALSGLTVREMAERLMGLIDAEEAKL